MNEEDFIKQDYFISDYVLVGTDLDEIKEKKEILTEQQKDAWKEIYAFAHMTNRSGRKYSKDDINHLCAQFYLSFEKVEKAFKKVFEENVDEFGINDKPVIYKVEVWLKKHWDFAENEITQVPEFKEKGQDKFQLLNVDSIFRKLQHAGFNFPMDKLKSLLRSDFMTRFNPFHDYFHGLEPWDGETDHIQKFASYVSVEDQSFFEAQFKKALVRCIGCSLYGFENRIVFVFVGEKQSTGKSTFIRFINPFGIKYYTEAPIHNNKDSTLALAENFIYNIEELATASKMDVNRLKSVISTATIKERKAYAVNAVEQPRRANFFGSTNNNEFLTDTQNSRWLCFNIVGIDWAYKKHVDIKKVWAQAFALYNDPDFNDQLTAEETNYRDRINKNYEVSDYEKELIKVHFRVCKKEEGDFYSNADILKILELDAGKKLDSRFIGRSMVQLGFENDVKKMNGHTVRGYYVVKKLSEYKTNEPEQKKLF